MSEKLTGTLEKKVRSKTATGKEYYSVQVNGEKMTAWASAMSQVDGCREGETVEVTFDKNEKGYRNVTGMSVQTGTSSLSSPVSDQVGTPNARDVAVTLGGIGHDVAAIIGGILMGPMEELGPKFSWAEENYPRIVALAAKMSDELFGVRTTALYGPQGE